MSKRKESLSVLVAEHMQLDGSLEDLFSPAHAPVQRRGDVLAELRRGAATRPVLEALEEAVAERRGSAAAKPTATEVFAAALAGLAGGGA